MAVLYAFPMGIYGSGYSPASVDEIEITLPDTTAAKAANSPQAATFRLDVNSFVLHNIVVTITLTRFQTITGGGNVIASNGAVWVWETNTPSTPIYEGKWTRTQINVNTSTTFTLNFTAGPVGNYILTYRVTATELQIPAVVEVLLVVV
jgi:hypothetical protein